MDRFYQLCFKCVFLQVASKAPKKVAKASAGKKVSKGASAGKKISAKKPALGSKKSAPKSNKAGGKKGATPSGKKPASKTNKGKSGKSLLPRWSPFGDFGPHGDQNEYFFLQSPHFLYFRLQNA